MDALFKLVAGGNVLVLSGAGLSTESGIPDYRGPDGVRRRTPMTYQTFVGDPAARRRYWARSHLGWRGVSRAWPNAGHRAVAQLQRLGMIGGIVTQNVDGLHQAGGAGGVVELHGSLSRVVCLRCDASSSRSELERRLHEANSGFTPYVSAVNPDGDVELDDATLGGFRTVDCVDCGGMLKPDVVFFGENVPAERVERCNELVDQARALLVLGSSLAVMSGRRFVRRAVRTGIPVAIVNRGTTREDGSAALIVDAALGATLSQLARRAVARSRPAREIVEAAALEAAALGSATLGSAAPDAAKVKAGTIEAAVSGAAARLVGG